MNVQQAPEWAAVLISIIALAVSLIERRANERRAEREELRRLLDNFLLPLQTIMGRTRKRFEYLTNGLRSSQELRVLEFPPNMMHAIFEQLPDDRKLFWQLEIGQLQKDDEEAVVLIRQYASQSRFDPRFQKACAEFDGHVTDWIGKWNYVLNIEQGNLKTDLNEPIADPFPQTFEPSLAAEADRLKTAVGIAR